MACWWSFRCQWGFADRGIVDFHHWDGDSIHPFRVHFSEDGIPDSIKVKWPRQRLCFFFFRLFKGVVFGRWLNTYGTSWKSLVNHHLFLPNQNVINWWKIQHFTNIPYSLYHIISSWLHIPFIPVSPVYHQTIKLPFSFPEDVLALFHPPTFPSIVDSGFPGSRKPGATFVPWDLPPNIGLNSSANSTR